MATETININTFIDVTQTGHGFVAGDVVYRTSGGAYALADATAEVSSRVVGMVAEASANTFKIALQGHKINGLSGFTDGTTYYLSETTTGGLTDTPPSAPNYVVPVCIAVSTTSVVVGNLVPQLAGSSSTLVPVGNTLFVDSVNGDDGTGTPGELTLPYLTIAAAIAASTSGDTIFVRRGTYNENNIQKDGVDIDIDPGAFISYSGSSADGVIDDSSGAVVAKYTGRGNFKWDSSGSTETGTINVVDPGSDVSIFADTISADWTGLTSPGHAPAVIWGSGGKLKVDANEISLVGASFNGQYVVAWSDGAMHVVANVIKSDIPGNLGGIAGVNAPATTSGEFWVDAQQILTPVAMQCAGSDARMWVRAMDISIDSSSNISIYASGGRFYVDSLRIKNAATDGVAVRNEGGILWLTTQKITASGSSGIAISLVDGTTNADVMEIEDGGSLGYAIVCDFGTHVIKNTRFVGGSSASGIQMNGGTLILENCTFDTSANSSGNPVVLNGGSLILRNTKLQAHGSRESIYATSPQTIVCDSSTVYQALNSNVTATHDLYFDQGGPSSGEVAVANADGTWSWETLTASDISDFNAAALLAAPAETTATIGALVNGATAKTTPVDADMVGLMDSAAANILKKLSWLNIKATLKTYFDTLYPSGSGTSTGTNTGDQTSVSGNAGTATALQTSRNIDGQAFNGTADITVIAPGTHAATSKATPVDADELPLVDSAASNVLKKLTWANLKATIKTYFDTLYQGLNANLTAIVGLTTAADKVTQWTGSGTAALVDLKLGTEAAYTGTPTFTAGAAPSGASNLRQYYTQVGNLVTWQISMTYASAGTTITNLVLTFPTEFPTPDIPTGFTGASVNIAGAVLKSSNGLTGNTINSQAGSLRRNAGNTAFELYNPITSGTYSTFIWSGSYFTA